MRRVRCPRYPLAPGPARRSELLQITIEPFSARLPASATRPLRQRSTWRAAKLMDLRYGRKSASVGRALRRARLGIAGAERSRQGAFL